FARPFKQVVEHIGDVQAVKLGEKLDKLLLRRAAGRVFGSRVNLDSVARREQHRLTLGKTAVQVVERLAGLRRAERQSLARRQARIPMTATDDLEFHARPPVEASVRCRVFSPCTLGATSW